MERGKLPITEKEKKLVEELGLVEVGERQSVIAKTLKIAQILHDNGIDLRKIQWSKTVNGKSKGIELRDIKQEEIDIEKIIEENGLDDLNGKSLFGARINGLRLAYNGKRKLCNNRRREKNS